MLVTVVKGRSKSCWYKEGWVIRCAKRKLKDGKTVCHVGRKVLNRSFEYASEAIRHCVLKMNIPEYRIVLGEDVYLDIKEQEKQELTLLLREQRVKELADQFLPSATSLNNLKLKYPGIVEQRLLVCLSIITSAETVYRKAVGNAFYWLEEDIKRFDKDN
jgi:hypothetical protein